MPVTMGMGMQYAMVCQSPQLYSYLQYSFWKHHVPVLNPMNTCTVGQKGVTNNTQQYLESVLIVKPH